MVTISCAFAIFLDQVISIIGIPLELERSFAANRNSRDESRTPEAALDNFTTLAMPCGLHLTGGIVIRWQIKVYFMATIVSFRNCVDLVEISEMKACPGKVKHGEGKNASLYQRIMHCK